jgi:hypothetical protein
MCHISGLGWPPSIQWVSSSYIIVLLTCENLSLKTPITPALVTDKVVSQDGRAALMWAAINGHAAVVKALIEKGADMNATEKVRRRHSVSTGEGMAD